MKPLKQLYKNETFDAAVSIKRHSDDGTTAVVYLERLPDESWRKLGPFAVRLNETGDLVISCYDHIVLAIGEVTDDEVINLFLTPLAKSAIIPRDDTFWNDEDERPPWTHELLCNLKG